MPLPDALLYYQQRINQLIRHRFSTLDETPYQLAQAMQYMMDSQGKRLRPLLVYATGQSFGIDAAKLDAAALAMECIHVYSLIHDDLPAMDNDDIRHGKASCHKAYDDATAILTGDALHSLAFEILSTQTITDRLALSMIQTLSRACGAMGMAGGQMLDLLAINKTLTEEQLATLHQQKTGCLLQACVELAVIAADQHQSESAKPFSQFAKHLGLAFQIQDDALDSISDHQENKPNFANTMTPKHTTACYQHYYDSALHTLRNIPADTSTLEQLTTWLRLRTCPTSSVI